jgi:hypothetical protein
MNVSMCVSIFLFEPTHLLVIIWYLVIRLSVLVLYYLQIST